MQAAVRKLMCCSIHRDSIGHSMPVAPQLGPQLASGASADIYAWGKQQVVKLYHRGSARNAAEREAENARVAYDAGISSPVPDGIVTVQDRVGVVFARVNGPTMLQLIGLNPRAVDEQAMQLARLHAVMHAKAGRGLPSLRDHLQTVAARIAAPAGPALLAHLHELPDAASLCHGDFHPGNVIVTATGPAIIDWFDAACGHPLADVARTSLLLQHADAPPGAGRGLEALRARLHGVYLAHYCELAGVAPADVEAWTLPVAVARLTVARGPLEREALSTLIQTRLADL
jgi:aminoglycoside phosphotransferase (APT) family kinase protein